MRPERTSNRREFLRGQAAVDALADLADRVALADAPLEPSGGAGRHYLVKWARRAMACQFEVFLNAGQYERGAEAGLAALDLVDALEEQLSIFRETSEVRALNRCAGAEPVPVESGLFELLSMCAKLHRATSGAFDITAGPLSRVWGFTHRAGRVPPPEELAQAMAAAGADGVRLDAINGAISFDRPGMEVNFGAIGKGFALDRCGELLATRGVEDFLLHGGRSSVLAHGDRGGDDAWTVGLQHPLRPGQTLARIRLRNAALGTSGASCQFFKHEGKRYGHILDPRTGWPASGVFSSTAVAPTAALADALSTAFYILGPDGAREYCESHPGVGFLMLVPNTTGSAVEIAMHGLPPESWEVM
jgi:thiamine biosynthesis lipoprotein